MIWCWKCNLNIWLVGGVEHVLYVSIYIYTYIYISYIGNFRIPTDFHIFQRGRYTTHRYDLSRSIGPPIVNGFLQDGELVDGMGGFPSNFRIPSGYVKIAIENDHRNSGFSH